MFSRVSLVVLAMAVVLSLSGCGSESSHTNSAAATETPSPTARAPDAAHPSEGPHGGHLIELGNEAYHAELLHDEKTHTVTVHLLDAAGQQPVGVPQPEITLQLFQSGEFVSYALKALQGQADAEGTASEFQIVDEPLCDALSREEEIRARLQVTIEGQPFTGNIEHTSHHHDDCLH